MRKRGWFGWGWWGQGRGRGGLPRCGYFLSGAVGAPFAPQIAKEQELDFLKNQADVLRRQLEQIEAGIRELATNQSQ